MKAVRQPTQKQDAPFGKRSMKDTTNTQIRCPCCDDAVRPLDATPCPECRGCAFCGQKLRRGETLCTCGQADKPDRVATLKKRFGIPEDQLAAERQQTAVGRQDRPRSIIYGLFIGLMAFLGGFLHTHSLGYRLLFAAVIASICLALAKLAETLLLRRTK
jgi:hypothetical protein